MKTIERIGGFLLVLSLVVMTGAVFLSVIFRYAVNQPLLWSDEIASSSLAWMTFIGAAMLYSQRSGHLNIAFVTDRLSPRNQRLAGVIADLIELVLLLVIFVGALVFIHFNKESVTSALEIPLYLVYGVIPVTALVACVFLIRRMIYGLPEGRVEPTYHGEHG